jgi:hypothetical protein
MPTQIGGRKTLHDDPPSAHESDISVRAQHDARTPVTY